MKNCCTSGVQKKRKSKLGVTTKYLQREAGCYYNNICHINLGETTANLLHNVCSNNNT